MLPLTLPVAPHYTTTNAYGIVVSAASDVARYLLADDDDFDAGQTDTHVH